VAQCSQACPNGVEDIECLNGEMCFGGVTCSSNYGDEGTPAGVDSPARNTHDK
jgi:hypothetical protein